MRLFKVLLLLIVISPFVKAQETRENENKKIVVLGSSVAAGWVTSYQEKYDFKNGYAYRLERYLSDKGFDVINKSIPGNNTKDALERFDKDVLSEKPDYLIIGLSMSNEGLETEDPDSVFQSYQSGINELISKCEANNIYPVLGLCYANDNFTPLQYEYLKRMNIEMNSYGYPCINFLGAFEDGDGHFPGSYKFDPNHPDNRGHEEFFLCFIPDLFQAIDAGVPTPKLIKHDSYIKLGERRKNQNLLYFPSENMHSFSFGFGFKTKSGGHLAQIQTQDKDHNIEIDKQGRLLYCGEVISANGVNVMDGEWHKMMITHRYLDQTTQIHIDENHTSVVKEQIQPAAFVLGSGNIICNYRNLMIYRAALNVNEISALMDQIIHASMVCYAPLENGSLKNLAQTKSKIYLDPENEEELFKNTVNKIEITAKNRDNELKVEDKKSISMDPKKYEKFAGKYEIAQDDYFTIEVEDNKIYFVDRGRKGEILPESENKFFIKYPGELTFTFKISENGKVESMVANFNGHQILARKIYE